MQDEKSIDQAQRPTSQLPPTSFPAEKYTSLTLRFMNRLKMTGRSNHTITAYRNDLNLFGQFLKESGHDPSFASNQLVGDWSYFLEKHGRTSSASVRRAHMCVRTFLHFLVETSVITGSPFLTIKSPKQPKNHLLRITDEHFSMLCKRLKTLALAKDQKALRDYALVLVLGKCGLKASEAAALQWGDVHLPIKGKGSLSVRAKDKNRLIFLDAQTKAALTQLKDHFVFRSFESQNDLGSVFFGFQNISRKLSEKSMHRHSVKFIIYELCQELIGFPYHSESFRNHAILEWIRLGFSLEKIADLAGYSSMQSLERFLTPDSTLAHFRRQHRTTRSVNKDESKSATEADRKIRNH